MCAAVILQVEAGDAPKHPIMCREASTQPKMIWSQMSVVPRCRNSVVIGRAQTVKPFPKRCLNQDPESYPDPTSAPLLNQSHVFGNWPAKYVLNLSTLHAWFRLHHIAALISPFLQSCPLKSTFLTAARIATLTHKGSMPLGLAQNRYSPRLSIGRVAPLSTVGADQALITSHQIGVRDFGRHLWFFCSICSS